MNSDSITLTTTEGVTRFIKAVRDKRGLSQKELARRLGVKQSSLSELEARGEAISLRKFQELFGAMGGQLTLRVSFSDSCESQELSLPLLENLQVSVQQMSVRPKNCRKENQPMRDYTRYDVVLNGNIWRSQNKRRTMQRVVQHLCNSGVTPEQIASCLPWRGDRLFRSMAGKVTAPEFVAQTMGSGFDSTRYFLEQDELLFVNGKTYTFSNQWGERTSEAIQMLLTAFPNRGVSVEPTNP